MLKICLWSCSFYMVSLLLDTWVMPFLTGLGQQKQFAFPACSASWTHKNYTLAVTHPVRLFEFLSLADAGFKKECCLMPQRGYWCRCRGCGFLLQSQPHLSTVLQVHHSVTFCVIWAYGFQGGMAQGSALVNSVPWIIRFGLVVCFRYHRRARPISVWHHHTQKTLYTSQRKKLVPNPELWTARQPTPQNSLRNGAFSLRPTGTAVSSVSRQLWPSEVPAFPLWIRNPGASERQMEACHQVPACKGMQCQSVPGRKKKLHSSPSQPLWLELFKIVLNNNGNNQQSSFILILMPMFLHFTIMLALIYTGCCFRVKMTFDCQ